MNFSEGMTEDDEVFGDATRVAAEALNDMRNREGTARTFLSLLVGFPLSTAIEWDPTKPKTNKWLGKKFTDVTRRPDSEKYGETTWRDNLKKDGGSWQTALSPRYFDNLAESDTGFEKVFGPLKTGGYGYRWPESRQEHDRYRGNIGGIPYGPSRPHSRPDGAEVNQEAMKRRKYLLERRNFWIRTGNMNMVKQIDAQLANIQY